MSIPVLSVVIPTYKDDKRLATCIAALQSQQTDILYEIIIVDNAGVDSTRHLCADLKVKYIEELKPGSYNARNTGIKAASGKYIALTDSDCIASEDWLSQGYRCLESARNIGWVSGYVRMFIEYPEKSSVAEIYDAFKGFNQKNNFSKGASVTANLFVPHKIFEDEGLFRSGLNSGEDIAWTQMIYKRGYACLYEPNLVVLHPARKSIKALLKKKRRVISGKYYQFRTDYSLTSFSANRLLRAILIPPLCTFGRLFRKAKYQSNHPYIIILIDVILYYFGTYLKILYKVRLIRKAHR
jgi:glycosyltransferase involved in cell wall biosynthesis